LDVLQFGRLTQVRLTPVSPTILLDGTCSYVNPKSITVLITAVDNHPIASGLVTYNVITCLVSVGYLIILSLDWLHWHNPSINWTNMAPVT
jgi:hypothetical protein